MKSIYVRTQEGFDRRYDADAIEVQGASVILRAGEHLNIVAVFCMPQSVVVHEE